MSSFTKKRKDGFTIIEVMIVLAIAGLIMLIVFLAVPALQRTARNTQRKNDASAIAAAVANYIDNNGGTLPTGIGSAGGDTATLVIGTLNCQYTSVPPAPAAWGCNTESAKLGYFTVNGGTTTMNGGAAGGNSANVWFQNDTAIAAPPTIVINSPSTAPTAAIQVNTNTISILTGMNCNASNTNVGSLNSRTAAILYVTEVGSGNGSLQCVEQ